MELALFIYLTSVIGKFGPLLAFICILSTIVLLGSITAYMLEGEHPRYSWEMDKEGGPSKQWESRKKLTKKTLKYSLIIASITAILNITIPSERTMYIMAGAYAAQQIATSEKANVLGDKVYKIIDGKLQEYIKELEKPIKNEKGS